MPLLGELRRRNIFKVSLAYMLVSWLIVQLAGVILPTFGAPDWVMQILVLFLILAFPVAVLLSWAFELTPEGLKATADVDKTQSITVETGRTLNHIVIGLLCVAVVVLIVDVYVFPNQIPADPDVDYRRTIAVVPFTDSSAAAKRSGYLAAGIRDDLVTRLANISALRIVSRTAATNFANTASNIREIGADLGADSILEGSIQRSDDLLSVNMLLVDTRTGEHVWTDSFEADMNAGELFAVLSEVASAVADELDAELSDVERQRINAVPTENIDALEAYFAGTNAVRQRHPESMSEAIDLFKRAVNIDPQFAPAWAALAQTLIDLPNYAPSADPIRARMDITAAANRAVGLDPGSPNAIAVMGRHLLLQNYDWDGAENSYRLALSHDALNSNALLWYSRLLSWQGRHDEALALGKTALDADPLSLPMKSNLSYILGNARQWDNAFDLGAEVLLHIQDSSLMAALWAHKIRARRLIDAAAQLENLAQATGSDAAAAAELSELISRAQTEQVSVEIPATLLEQLKIDAQSSEAYAAVGNAEYTIAALQDAYKSGIGFRTLLSIGINPSFDFIRNDPRFIDLMEDVGLARTMHESP